MIRPQLAAHDAARRDAEADAVMVMLILAAQAAPPVPAGPPAGPPAPRRTAAPVLQRCDAGPPPSAATGTAPADDIVVCARSQEQFRLRPLPPQRVAGPVLPRAETGFIGKSKIGVEAQDAGVGGFTSHRAMVKVRVPF